MNFKGLTLVLASAITLAACGGGGSSDSNSSSQTSPNTVLEKQWSMYASSYLIDSDNLLEKMSLNIAGNTIYFNVDYLAENRAIDEFEDIDHFVSIVSDYLTDEGLYRPITDKTPQGYVFAHLVSQKNNQWVFTPASQNNLKGLQLTENFTVLDLSNKEMGLYIDGYSYLTGQDASLAPYVGQFPQRYYQQLKGKTFPQGSTCLKHDSSSSNKNYIQSYGTSWLGFEELENESFRKTTLGGYQVAIAHDRYSPYVYDYEAYFTASDEVTKYGSYYAQGTTYQFSKELQDYQADLNEAIKEYGANSPQALIETHYLSGLKTECALFNQIASQAIDQQVRPN